MKIMVLWGVLYNPVDWYQCFGGTCYLHLQYLPHCTITTQKTVSQFSTPSELQISQGTCVHQNQLHLYRTAAQLWNLVYYTAMLSIFLNNYQRDEKCRTIGISKYLLEMIQKKIFVQIFYWFHLFLLGISKLKHIHQILWRLSLCLYIIMVCIWVTLRATCSC